MATDIRYPPGVINDETGRERSPRSMRPEAPLHLSRQIRAAQRHQDSTPLSRICRRLHSQRDSCSLHPPYSASRSCEICSQSSAVTLSSALLAEETAVVILVCVFIPVPPV